MAIYHLSMKPVTRAHGRSATAAVAYRSATLVRDARTDQTFDYRRKKGVEYSEIVLPSGRSSADAAWARDRERLWNAQEAIEQRSNSRVAREYEVALPHELGPSQRIELTRSFSRLIADRYDCAVDFAVHRPHRRGDDRNHHAHLLATTRTVGALGLGDKTPIEWSDADRRKAGLGSGKDELLQVRELWASLVNDKLKERGLAARVDHRSLEAQGIDRQPSVHLGPAVTDMERRGIRTQVVERIGIQEREAIQKRLEAAAEFGRRSREAKTVSREIFDLSLDLRAALRERRDQSLQHPPRESTAPNGVVSARGPRIESAGLEVPAAGGKTPFLEMVHRWREDRRHRLEQDGSDAALSKAAEKQRAQGLDRGDDGLEL